MGTNYIPSKEELKQLQTTPALNWPTHLPNLTALEERIKGAPPNASSLMEKGLMLAKAFYYREAIATFSQAIVLEPFNGLLYRHRGHRFISIRRFEEAVADFELSTRLDPNNWSTWYHLGLAHYLLGNWQQAEKAYRYCENITDNPDSFAAVADWLWMTLMRQNKVQEAQELLEGIEEGRVLDRNMGYYRRLLMYKGIIGSSIIEDEFRATTDSEVEAILGYGLGVYCLVNSELDRAIDIWRKVSAVAHWPAFGCIAAEVELIRFEGQYMG